jgi:hypothetical protein
MKRRSFRAEREFGLTVGGLLTLIGAWWLFRGKLISLAHLAIPMGMALTLLGLTYPRSLVLPNKAWMTLAEGIGFVSTRIILAFVYFLVLTPTGLIKRAMGWDPLHRRTESRESYWRPYSERQQNPLHYEKMF